MVEENDQSVSSPSKKLYPLEALGEKHRGLVLMIRGELYKKVLSQNFDTSIRTLQNIILLPESEIEKGTKLFVFQIVRMWANEPERYPWTKVQAFLQYYIDLIEKIVDKEKSGEVVNALLQEFVTKASEKAVKYEALVRRRTEESEEELPIEELSMDDMVNPETPTDEEIDYSTARLKVADIMQKMEQNASGEVAVIDEAPNEEFMSEENEEGEVFSTSKDTISPRDDKNETLYQFSPINVMKVACPLIADNIQNNQPEQLPDELAEALGQGMSYQDGPDQESIFRIVTDQFNFFKLARGLLGPFIRFFYALPESDKVQFDKETCILIIRKWYQENPKILAEVLESTKYPEDVKMGMLALHIKLAGPEPLELSKTTRLRLLLTVAKKHPRFHVKSWYNDQLIALTQKIDDIQYIKMVIQLLEDNYPDAKRMIQRLSAQKFRHEGEEPALVPGSSQETLEQARLDILEDVRSWFPREDPARAESDYLWLKHIEFLPERERYSSARGTFTEIGDELKKKKLKKLTDIMPEGVARELMISLCVFCEQEDVGFDCAKPKGKKMSELIEEVFDIPFMLKLFAIGLAEAEIELKRNTQELEMIVDVVETHIKGKEREDEDATIFSETFCVDSGFMREQVKKTEKKEPLDVATFEQESTQPMELAKARPNLEREIARLKFIIKGGVDKEHSKTLTGLTTRLGCLLDNDAIKERYKDQIEALLDEVTEMIELYENKQPIEDGRNLFMQYESQMLLNQARAQTS